MANPNRGAKGFMRNTVERLRTIEGESDKSTPFSRWVIAQAEAGFSYATMAEAEVAFAAKEQSQ